MLKRRKTSLERIFSYFTVFKMVGSGLFTMFRKSRDSLFPMDIFSKSLRNMTNYMRFIIYVSRSSFWAQPQLSSSSSLEIMPKRSWKIKNNIYKKIGFFSWNDDWGTPRYSAFFFPPSKMWKIVLKKYNKNHSFFCGTMKLINSLHKLYIDFTLLKRILANFVFK